jgi:putative transposase
MTKASMALADLAEKGADADLLREMIRYVAQRLMEMDVETLCGPAYGERSCGRWPISSAASFRSWRP